MGGRTGFGTCSPHPELCGFDYRPRVGQLGCSGCSEQTGEGEKSSSRSPAAHKTHCGGGMAKRDAGDARCFPVPGSAKSEPKLSGLWSSRDCFGAARDAGEESAPLC